jgi:5-methylcytosine-specific restriction endonuclease McrA
VSCKQAGDNRDHQKRPIHDDGLCYTCWQARRRKRRTQRRVAGVWASFKLTEAEYLAIRESQRSDGRVRCLGCRRPVDAGKEPAIDHSHRLEQAGLAIRYTVRMLLCQPCNRFLGYISDDPAALIRLALGLIEMPAQKVLSKLDQP